MQPLGKLGTIFQSCGCEGKIGGGEIRTPVPGYCKEASTCVSYLLDLAALASGKRDPNTAILFNSRPCRKGDGRDQPAFSVRPDPTGRTG